MHRSCGHGRGNRAALDILRGEDQDGGEAPEEGEPQFSAHAEELCLD